MDREIKSLLKDLVSEYGIYEIAKPDRCLELLSKRYGGIKEEFLYITRALEFGIVEDLIKLRHNEDKAAMIGLLSSRLVVRMKIKENLSLWIVNIWAYALGLIDSMDEGEVQRLYPLKKIVVQKDGDSPVYDSLGNAIRDIEQNGEIEIMPGVYYGHFKIKKPVRIRGAFRDKVIIENDMMPVFTIINTGGVIIENLSMAGRGRTDYDRANIIEVVNSEVIIRNTDIRGSSLNGLYIYGNKSDVRVEDSEISMCTKSGVVISDDAKCTLENTTVTSCLDSLIVARDYANLFLNNCKIYGGENSGIKIMNDANLFADASEISNNKRAGIIVGNNSCSNIRNSSIHHNRGYGIILSDMSCTTIENCQVYQNTISGIRLDKSSDLFNYSENIKDTVVTISRAQDDNDETIKSEAIDEYVKNPPETSIKTPPDTLQSLVIIISFVLVFEITGMIIAEMAQLLLSENLLRLSILLPLMGLLGVFTGLIYIIKRT